MTKAKLLELLSNVEDDARLCTVLRDGVVVDIDEAYYGKALPEFRTVDEVFLLVTKK